MELIFAWGKEGPALYADARLWIGNIGLELIIAGRRYSTFNGGLKQAGYWPLAGEDELGAYRGLGLIYCLESTELLELRLKAYGAEAIIELEALQELDGTAVADSFLDTTFNLVLYPRDGKFLLYTWGLRHAGERGRWPEGVVGGSLEEMPEEPFAPLVVWTDDGALALAPLNYFLTSPLRPWKKRGNRAIAHGFHGAVEKIPQGTIRKLGLVPIAEPDPVAALYKLGDLLLRAGKRGRLGPLDDLLLKYLSYWNDYGAYYSEVFNPINEKTLLQLAEYFKREGIPVGYFGLDLWYYFERAGWATRYEPRGERFPRGLGALAAKTGLPFLLHLSAFDRDFQAGEHGFVKGEQAGYPAEPRRFYRDLGRRLKEEEGACGIWHDWLWVQQGSVGKMRADPELAERWFDEMATAFADEHLPMLLCMPTMGFQLASTKHKNVIAARSYCDHLNTQPEQVAHARAQGLEAELIPVQRYIRQNILVGLALHALGIYPFYDIFITNEDHPQGFAEPQAEREGLLRALSAGPVGIGDKLGFVNKKIIERLTLPEGRLAQPDHPPWPLADSLDRETLVAQTETSVGDLRWRYLLLANVGGRRASFQLDPRELFSDGGFVIYDCLREQLVNKEKIEGELEPAEVTCYLLAPRYAGLAPLGLARRYVPVPQGLLSGSQLSDDGWQLQLQLSPGYEYPLRIWCEEGRGLQVTAEGAQIVELLKQDGIYAFTLRAEVSEVHLNLRAE